MAIKFFTELVSKKFKFLSLCYHPKHYKTVGALSASSKTLSKTLANVIVKNDIPKKVLEVGAGTGPITKYILKNLNPHDVLDVVEITTEFIPELTNICKNHKACNIFNGSVLDFKSNYKFDYIISSLPFYSFTPPMVERILDNYKHLIAEDGIIVYFQYLFTDYINKFKKGKHREISQLKSNFHSNFKVYKKVEYRNMIPVIIWILKPKKRPS